MSPSFPSPLQSRSAPDRPPADPGRHRSALAVGWRSWRVRAVDGGAALEGLHAGGRWEAGATHAACRRCPPWMVNLHPVPVPSCECGLYAFSTLDEALHQFLHYGCLLHGCGQSAPVTGAVIGWGRVVQHGNQGWRAEHARPLAFLRTGHPLLDALARRHRVPIVSARGLRLLPLEYGEILRG